MHEYNPKQKNGMLLCAYNTIERLLPDAVRSGNGAVHLNG